MSTTLLDGIKRRAAQRRARTVRVANPDDALQVLVCRVPTDGLELDRLREGAERARKGKGAGVEFNRALLAACTLRIEEGGEAVELPDGEPATFREPALWDLLNDGDPHGPVRSAKDAVEALVVGGDGAIAAMAARLMREAKYDADEADTEDPTEG